MKHSPLPTDESSEGLQFVGWHVEARFPEMTIQELIVIPGINIVCRDADRRDRLYGQGPEPASTLTLILHCSSILRETLKASLTVAPGLLFCIVKGDKLKEV